ncbi:hypothetical protein HanHA300_Chr17g0641781 [Helianthus annuus]|nr:hypothetical protein HanHA300_Chr17g0641781 [Helianthus annuus]KAJ0635188.1 hypothetical protein HanOQP8_Chr17g0648101 [Helianthus annuus]
MNNKQNNTTYIYIYFYYVHKLYKMRFCVNEDIKQYNRDISIVKISRLMFNPMTRTRNQTAPRPQLTRFDQI